MRTKREMEGGCEPCREMLQTEGGDTNWGAGSVSWRGIFIFLLSWIEETFTWLWQMSEGFCASVRSLLFSCCRDAFSVNKKTEWKKVGRYGESRRCRGCFVDDTAVLDGAVG